MRVLEPFACSNDRDCKVGRDRKERNMVEQQTQGFDCGLHASLGYRIIM